MKSLEEKEKSINLLERIDNNISLIKQELKEMKSKFRSIHSSFKKVNANSKSWMDFFKVQKGNGTKNGEKLKNGPVSCDDIFSNDEFVYKSDNRNIDDSVINRGSIASIGDDYSDVNTELNNIPEALMSEPVLIKLHDFIKSKGKVSLEEIFENFQSVSPEKLEIFIKFLHRRNHIYIENEILIFRTKNKNA